jgi:2-dehydro-3-deoxygalactonokinase
MAGARFVAGDWGTSRLRLFLCDAQGVVLETIEGPGISAVTLPFEQLFESLMRPWELRHGPMAAVLCGMIGSSIGWVQTPYIACPAEPEKIIAGCSALRASSVHIVPGVRCVNGLQAPDFMRGEETQILGAVTLDSTLRQGRRLLCLPGTHTKWVLLEDGIIKEFLTAPTGELFGALRDHSVLVAGDSTPREVDDDGAFAQGIDRFNEFPQTQVLHRLFECRSRLLNGELDARNTAAFLSGLLIAADVSGALQVFASRKAEATVCLIGDPRLTRLYAAALSQRSFGTQHLDGAAASLAGLTRVHQYITSSVERYAS